MVVNSNHQKPYEILANEIYNKVKTYLATNSINQNVVYWITGYGTGGGIANLLSAKMIDKPLVSTAILNINTIFDANNYKWEETGMTNVYSYTFGSPNVVYTLDDDTGVNNNKYKSIFNVVDNNDVSAHLLSTMIGWHKYGWNMSLTEMGNKCKDIISLYNGVLKNKNRDDFYKELWNSLYSRDKKTMYQIMAQIHFAWYKFQIENDDSIFKVLKKYQDGSYRTFCNLYGEYYKELEPKHSIKNYFELSKKLLPENMKIGDGWMEIDKKNNNKYKSMSEALKDMGEWYCKNVYTYDPFSDKDFARNKTIVSFSERFQYDYDRASDEAKRERERKVKEHNEQYEDNKYLIENFKNIQDYNYSLETFVDHHGASALYECNLLHNDCYNTKEVGDDCSAFTLATMYYATMGEFDSYNSLNIYDISSNILCTYNKNNDDRIKDLDTIGFKKIPVTKEMTLNNLESGDILVSNNHCEFYYKNGETKTSFGWGSVKKKFPNDNNSIKEAKDQPYFVDTWNEDMHYTCIYRLNK